jgi:hypothetical protein
MMRRWTLAAVLCCACGLPGAPQLATEESAIVGGTTDTADVQVFELRFAEVGNPANRARCSATLIAAHTLVTAGHCVDPSTLGASAITMDALNVTDDSTAQATDLIHVTKMQAHPMYNNITYTNDIALVLLEHAPAGVAPKDWNAEDLSGQGGKPIRAIGYGDDVGGTSSSGRGTRREAALTFGSIASGTFQLGDGIGHGICHGDSGGPSFFTFPDGVERVVGVHSLTLSDACLLGTDTRIDRFPDFIDGWIAQNEPHASCEEDGLCAENCPTPDIDCLCAADGQCTAACTDPMRDPDCPPDCGLNGVCSQQACPAPDPDCVAFGEPCTAAAQCASGLCTTYCTQSCSTDTECAAVAGMTCDATSHVCAHVEAPPSPAGSACTPGMTVCAKPTLCTGDAAQTATCRASCQSDADCSGGTCVAGFDGVTHFCKAAGPTMMLPPAQNGHGCASAAGLLPWLAVLALRRRRKSEKGD